MLGSYICKQCRTRLSRRIAPVRVPQWQPRATIVSFRERARDDAQPTQPEAPLPSQSQPNTAQGEDPNIPPRRYRVVDKPSQPPRLGRYSRGAKTEYEDNVRQERAAHIQQDQGPAAAIADALKKKQAEAAWAIFEQRYTSIDCEALANPPESDIALLNNGKIFSDLLKGVTDAFCYLSSEPKTTPAAVLLRYEQLGLAQSEHWLRFALSNLTHRALMAINGLPAAENGRPLIAVLSELLSVWRLFFQTKGLKDLSLDTASTGWNLPATDALQEVFQEKDFGMRLQQFLPRFPGNAELAFCAVYFYTISSALSATESLHRDATPFVRFLERLLASSYVDPVFTHVNDSSRFTLLTEGIRREITEEINNAPLKAMSDIASRGKGVPESEADQAANLEAFYLKRIGRAVLSKDSAAILGRLWNEVLEVFRTEGKPAIPRRVYNAFLSGFLVQLQAPRSVEIWNHMMRHGVKPDIQSWVALMDGCSKARDLEGFNAMWTRMLKSGIEPDNYAWTSRVHGLITLGETVPGIAALEDMGKRWLSAETVIKTPQTHSQNRKGAKNLSSTARAINNLAKPSIEVVNGAITAIVKLTRMSHDKKVGYVQKILGWAGIFSIQPDVITYNSLMQMYIRGGQFSTAFKILRQMEVEKIEVDLATYGLLVTASFDNGAFDGISESQQSDKIITLLESIEASGLKLNQVIYGAAIDRLLKKYANANAVSRIIDYMQARKISPSAPIYTSIITSYFQQRPPAIAAVDVLTEQLFTNHRIEVDRYLFERIIEGYARHGEIGRMMSVVTRMSAKGRYPGWSALNTVLNALLRDGDYDRARDLLRDVEHGRGGTQGRIFGREQDRYRFFATVRESGLLENDGPGQDQVVDHAPEADPFRASSSTNAQEYETQWLDPESTGEFTWNANTNREGAGDAVLDQEMQQHEAGRRQSNVQQPDRQDWLEPTSQPSDMNRYEPAQYGQEHMSTARYQHNDVELREQQAYEDVSNGNRARKARTPDEEDVHGFLSDEHDDYHSKVDRP